MHERSAYVIFCDDIRIEQSNKRTFVGIYGTELYAETLPIILPKLCVISTLICSLQNLPKAFGARLVMAGAPVQHFSVPEDQLAEWRTTVTRELEPEVDEFADEEPPKARISVEQIISPFVVLTEGRLSAYIDTELGTVRAGSLRIIRGNGPAH